MNYPGGDAEVLLNSGDPAKVEVLLRGPAVSVAAIRTWLEQRAQKGGCADARTMDDPQRQRLLPQRRGTATNWAALTAYTQRHQLPRQSETFEVDGQETAVGQLTTQARPASSRGRTAAWPEL
jgi:hypothetical protein